MMVVVAILIFLVINVPAYIYVYFAWRKDCKEIGKDNLAISLKERMKALFLCLTLPCILGLISNKNIW